MEGILILSVVTARRSGYIPVRCRVGIDVGKTVYTYRKCLPNRVSASERIYLD